MAPLVPSPIYDALRFLSDEQIRWKVAVYHTQNETREAPWYPAWDHTARKLDSIDCRKLSMTVPLICSQQPISFEIDAVEKLDDGEHEPSLDDGDISTHALDAQAASLEATASETSLMLKDFFPDKTTPPRPHLFAPGSGVPATPRRPTKPHARGPSFVNNTPTTPTRPRLPTGSTNAQRLPNTKHFPISSLLPPSSEPRYSSSPPRSLEDRPRELLSPAHVSSDHVPAINYLTEQEKRILAHANRLRSTRIPDLLRRVFKLWGTGETSIYDLIIEIKKVNFLLTNRLDALRRQILAQAEHIFAADPMVQSVGCILAIGDRWRYEEAYRPGIINAVSAMEIGSDYVDRPSDPHTSSTRHHSSLPPSDSSDKPDNRLPQDSILRQKFMGSTTMISICHADSDQLLAAVYERLKTLNPSYWSDEGIDQVEPGVINLQPQFDMETDEDVDEGDELGDAIVDDEEYDSARDS